MFDDSVLEESGYFDQELIGETNLNRDGSEKILRDSWKEDRESSTVELTKLNSSETEENQVDFTPIAVSKKRDPRTSI